MIETKTEPLLLIDAIKDVRRIHAAEASLAEFTKQAWHVLEPSTELKWGWAMDAICEHLEAVSRGDIKRLLMNVPPGSSKSLLTGVFWPAWEWIGNPSLRYLSTAHKQDLAVRDNLKCRRLITSSWYQYRWPVQITGDQNAKTKFENNKTGFREAMAFQSMTGSRGDRVILDDPLSVDDAQSEAALAGAESTFREALPTRVNNDDSAIVVIMQRLNEKDTSGIILNEKLGYTHLCLPMEFESARRCITSIGFRDPRKKEGELLFPDRFSARTVTELKRTLGEYAYAGQMQQNPSPVGGGILQPVYLKLWSADKPIPALDFVMQSYDTAFTANTANDPTAQTTFGFFTHNGQQCALILDSWDEHLAYPQLRSRMIDDWHATYGADEHRKGRKADRCLIEEKGSGIALVQELRMAGIPVVTYNPGRADKVSRAHQITPLLETGCVYILESKKNPGEPISWVRPLLKQMEQFPNGAHDDLVDTLTQGLIYARDCHLLELEAAAPDVQDEYDYYAKKPRVNPYSV